MQPIDKAHTNSQNSLFTGSVNLPRNAVAVAVGGVAFLALGAYTTSLLSVSTAFAITGGSAILGYVLWNCDRRMVGWIRQCYDASEKTNKLGQTALVQKETKSVNVELPPEISLMILQKLSLKDLMQTKQVNKAWLNVSKDKSIWKALGSRLGVWDEATENSIIEKAKKALHQIQNVESTKNVTDKDVIPHLNLSKMGFRSLDETTKLAFQAKYNDAYSQDVTYYYIAFEYLHRNQPLELENILPKMSVSAARGVVASCLIEHYLKERNLEKAFATMDFVKTDQLEWDRCFYSIIQKACNDENYAFMTKVLKKYEALDSESFANGTWAGCVVALQKLLLEKGKIGESNQLSLDFPQALDIAHTICEMRYYIFIHDLKRAESTALNCKDMVRYYAFSEIQKYYENNENKAEAERIEQLNEFKVKTVD